MNILVSLEITLCTQVLPTLLTAVQPCLVCVSLFVGVIWGEGIRGGGRVWWKGRGESLWFGLFNPHHSNTEVVMVTLDVVVEVDLVINFFDVRMRPTNFFKALSRWEMIEAVEKELASWKWH